MHEGGDRGADEQRRRSRADDGLASAGAPGGNRALQMFKGSVGGFEVAHGAVQHPAQDHLVQLAVGAHAHARTGVRTGARASTDARARARTGIVGARAVTRSAPAPAAPEDVGERTGGALRTAAVSAIRSRRRRRRRFRPRFRFRALVRLALRALVVRTVRAIRVGVRGLLGPVVHNSVSRRVILVPVLVPVPAHAWASITTRSAAIPREPYALTEPSEIPSVSATWASVMSAKYRSTSTSR
ncbi:hypothetical protein SMICM304S_05401 [Streptomyces microflavus]